MNFMTTPMAGRGVYRLAIAFSFLKGRMVRMVNKNVTTGAQTLARGILSQGPSKNGGVQVTKLHLNPSHDTKPH
jgi:hypothetical protein